MVYTFVNKLTAKRIAFFAFFLWLLSLSMVGLSLYTNNEHIYGFNILLSGWLASFFGNFSWFSNIFFLYGFIRICLGKSAFLSPFFAVLFSFNTFIFNEMLMNAGGGSSPIFGYGWGFVSWFCALLLLLGAAIVREAEFGKIKNNEFNDSWQRYLAVLVPIFVFGLFLYFYIHEHKVANVAEQKRLKGITFKKGKICSYEDVEIAKPLDNFNGILEIEYGSEDSVSHPYPFSDVEILLSWGIPVIRINNQDYSIKNNILISSIANKKSSAVLYIKNKSHSISAKLIDSTTQRIVFEQIWKRQPYGINDYIYCPEYDSFPSRKESPRKLAMKALNIKSKIRQKIRKFPKIIRINLTVMNFKLAGKKKWVKKQYLKSKEYSTTRDLRYSKSHNINCPPLIGFDFSKLNSRTSYNNPFVINRKTYYINIPVSYSICENEKIYLYGGSSSGGKYSLRVNRRSVLDFSDDWYYIFIFPKKIKSVTNEQFRIVNIFETDGDVFLKVVNMENGDTYTMQGETPE